MISAAPATPASSRNKTSAVQKLFSRRNVLGGSILLAVGIGYAVLTAALPNRTLPNTPGPAFFPWVISAGLIMLPLALILQSLREGQEDNVPIQFNHSRVLALGLFLAYIVLMPYIGFIVVSVPFFAALMWLYLAPLHGASG